MKKQIMNVGQRPNLGYVSPEMKSITVYTAEDTLLDYFTGGKDIPIDEDPDESDDDPRANYFNAWDDMKL